MQSLWNVVPRWSAWLFAASLASACARGGSGQSGPNGGQSGAMAGSGHAGAGGVSPSQSTGGAGGRLSIKPGICGNGLLTRDEACDDGNTVGGDGCSADCRAIETGYACQPPGTPCRPIARCGDGVLALHEACDDRNVKDGDGCSARCKVELGWKCDGDPSTCTATTCGDGKREGVETCDDGNGMPFDGCSATCQTEPTCKADGCSSVCGDGLVLNEDCDDGNTKDGDGCSADCKVETGFACTNEASCELRDGVCIERVPAIIRDFDKTHPDFGVGCGELTLGVVQDTLSPDNKPVLANGSAACIQSAASFAQWYVDDPNRASVAYEFTLYDNLHGGFVNRWGPNGEQWAGIPQYANIMLGGPAGGGCGMCTPSAGGRCFDPCVPWNNTSQACCADVSQVLFDGNPLFFPIDDLPNPHAEMRYRAKIPAEYGYDGWPWEDSVFPKAPMHNFHFTTEVAYWFKYAADSAAVLDFTGDDDVWVFVNGRLAVDLGAPHVPKSGSVTIDSTTAAHFGLSAGKVYEVRIFHAERKVEGSTFKLTLSGFNTRPSDCNPICGDGIVTEGEECDDGTNDGGYEECDKGCVLGPRCGDGVVQDGEDCDDGNRRDGDDCGSSCRNLIVN